FYSRGEAQVLVDWWREVYNKERPHMSLGYRTPAEAAETNITVDQRTGKGHYAAGVMGESAHYEYRFTQFIAGAPSGSQHGKTVNCLDQACGVATLIDLVCGSNADVQWLTQFGYVPELSFVGSVDNCNNPFFRNAIIQPNAVVGSDDTRWRFIDINGTSYIKRSPFDFHTWVEGGGKLYDATVGPTGSGKVPTIIGSRTDYRAAACDVSNTGVAGMEWRDDEAVPTKAPGYLPIIPNEPWLEAGYTDTQYTIEVKNADFARVEARPINIE
ncbi:MAG: transposase, partial [Planctomycetes bacterium]|nr:transposase [Planctomycetota bacterium]